MNTNQEGGKKESLSEGFSFLNQPASNFQCIKIDIAFQDSLKPVTNKGIFTTKPDSLLTGFKCGCWLDPGTFNPDHQLT